MRTEKEIRDYCAELTVTGDESNLIMGYVNALGYAHAGLGFKDIVDNDCSKANYHRFKEWLKSDKEYIKSYLCIDNIEIDKQELSDIQYITNLAVENALYTRAINDLICYCNNDNHTMLEYDYNNEMKDQIDWLYSAIKKIKSNK